MESETRQALNAYIARPDLVREHSNIEQAITQSGYGRKQLNELIQNAADAVDAPNGRIRVVLTRDTLYCANEGSPFTEAGYRTLMLSHSSEKRDDQIGRFGLGFKSVIQISDSPQIFSKSGSVRWDRSHSTELLAPLSPGLDSYPVLRIATPVSPRESAQIDPVLDELVSWATTVVKLPLLQQAAWLSHEMRQFPHEFLLFSQNIGFLEFDDRVEGTVSTWSARRNGSDVVLENGDGREKWKIFRHQHRVSPQAAVEAGSIAARETVDVTWAVPITGKPRRQLGAIWNYFPTSHKTSLRGIVNAAFKMNEDRHSMLHTLYNKEILQKTVPQMVAGAIAAFQDEADPASYLDLLPARGREALSWADSTLNEPIFVALASVPSLPDRSGILRPISELLFPPDLEDATRLEEMWDQWVGRNRPWLHRSASASKERRLMVRRLLALANKARSPIEQWLEEVTYGKQLDDFENALRIAVEIDKHHPDHRTAMRRSRIILMQNGGVRAPITTKAFLPIDEQDKGENLVSYELLHHGDASAHLRALDFQALDDRGKADRVARQVAKDYEDEGAAESLWRLSRSLPVPEMLAIMGDRIDVSRLRVRAKDGRWYPTTEVWLPNGLFSNSSGDEHLTVDDLFHRHDLTLLKNLGVRSTLAEPATVRSGATYDLWKSAEAARLSAESRSSPVPVSEASLRFGPVLTTDGLHLLTKASARTREKATQRILSNVQYKTKIEYSTTYKDPELIDGPDMWWVRHYGVLQTRLGLVDVKYCVGSVEGIPVGFVPYPGPENAEKLQLPDSADAVNWSFVLPLAEQELPTGRVHELYGLLAKLGVRRPKELLVGRSNGSTTRYPAEFITVAEDEDSHKFLLEKPELGVLHTGNTELTTALSENWNLNVVKVEFFSAFEHERDEEAEVSTIGSLYPFLHQVEHKIKRSTKCIPCKSLRTVRSNSYNVEQDIEAHDAVRVGSSFYYSSSLSSRRLLTHLLQDAGSTYRGAEVEAEMRRLHQIQRTLPPPLPEPEPAPDRLKTHVSGYIPIDGARDLSDQMKLIERAVLRHLDTPEANLFDLRLHFEMDTSSGINEETVYIVNENITKLNGQARFEE
ncbi:sacsin N-terminal ATP-binding-like domain-containing protein [Arthrobacter koreensis]|uniref:sacsin N-terminal ATP-binding-like domain-containing protein n=1 Tax=Arthrobacter koreensis TaxID=199136 RepID=UPI002DBF09CE|nr:hypothetical protein [Arthrobacter koreensis]MEB7503964.1 hypothetical protein [Arthrobacter koreensis]